MRFVGSCFAVCFLVACGDDLNPGTPNGVDRDGDLVDASEDCNDDDPTVYPGATEVCDDGVDNNCDGKIDDEGIGSRTWYPDADLDGFGDPAEAVFACSSALGDGWIEVGGDCDDNDGKIYPGADEVCDGVDQNCDGVPDDGLELVPYWVDGDGDGFGASDTDPVLYCAPQDGWVTNASDCDDVLGEVNPTAIDVCDSVDNDCDGTADNSATASVGTALYGRIGDAIDAVVGQPNPIVDVCAGTFTISNRTTLDPLEQVTLRGAGVADTTLRVNTSLQWLDLSALAGVVIEGMTLEGVGFASSLATVGEGASLRLEDVEVGEFPVYAIEAVDRETATEVSIVDAVFRGTGSALIVEGAVDVTLTNTTFRDVVSNSGPIVYLVATNAAAPTLACTNCAFLDNTKPDGQLRLEAAPGQPEIVANLTDTRFVDFVGTDTGPLVVDGSRVVGNNLEIRGGLGSPTEGGGIKATSSTIIAATVDDCSAQHGGGVHATDSVLQNLTVTNAQASQRGGGLYLRASELQGSTVLLNSAAEGGGVFMEATGQGSRIDQSTVADNSATVGGGLYLVGDNSLQVLDAATVVHRNVAGSHGSGVHVESGRIESGANFGTVGNPVTDNAGDDLSYLDTSGTVQEVEVDEFEWIVENGVFFFL